MAAFYAPADVLAGLVFAKVKYCFCLIRLVNCHVLIKFYCLFIRKIIRIRCCRQRQVNQEQINLCLFMRCHNRSVFDLLKGYIWYNIITNTRILLFYSCDIKLSNEKRRCLMASNRGTHNINETRCDVTWTKSRTTYVY